MNQPRYPRMRLKLKTELDVLECWNWRILGYLAGVWRRLGYLAGVWRRLGYLAGVCRGAERLYLAGRFQGSGEAVSSGCLVQSGVSSGGLAQVGVSSGCLRCRGAATGGGGDGARRPRHRVHRRVRQDVGPRPDGDPRGDGAGTRDDREGGHPRQAERAVLRAGRREPRLREGEWEERKGGREGGREGEDA